MRDEADQRKSVICGLSTGEILEVKQSDKALFKVFAILEQIIEQKISCLGKFYS